MFRHMLLVSAVLVFTSFGVGAKAPDRQIQVSEIRAQQAEIRQAAEAGTGRYRDLAPEKKRELFGHQDRVQALLGTATLTTELSEHNQVALFNSLEAISGIINKAEDERLVCQRHKPVGTKRPVTTCRTVAQLREAKELADRDQSRRNLQCSEATMGPGGCL